MEMHVRRARVGDRAPMVELWERSVRATHHFLKESDIAALRPLVAQELAGDSTDWWVLVSGANAVIGFLGYAPDTIEALFLDPDYRRQGGGTLLVAHAQSLTTGGLAVDVNEQNEEALRFYEAVGFAVVGRSPTDGQGLSFPILQLRRAAPGAARLPGIASMRQVSR